MKYNNKIKDLIKKSHKIRYQLLKIRFKKKYKTNTDTTIYKKTRKQLAQILTNIQIQKTLNS